MFEVEHEPWFEIERCDECDRFDTDFAAHEHVAWLIAHIGPAVVEELGRKAGAVEDAS